MMFWETQRLMPLKPSKNCQPHTFVNFTKIRQFDHILTPHIYHYPGVRKSIVFCNWFVKASSNCILFFVVSMEKKTSELCFQHTSDNLEDRIFSYGSEKQQQNSKSNLILFLFITHDK